MMIASDRQIKLSTMTGKLTGFKAINTNTVTNDFCQKMNKQTQFADRATAWRCCKGRERTVNPLGKIIAKY
jgi:hypothetical protein